MDEQLARTDPAAVAQQIAKSAKRRLGGQRAFWRKLRLAGKAEEAMAYAKLHRLTAETAPTFTIPEPETITTSSDSNVPMTIVVNQELAPVTINGWPVETTATITNTCRNRKLVLLRLADGRDAAMWTMGRRWRLGSKLRVSLDDARADPKYLPIEGSIE